MRRNLPEIDVIIVNYNGVRYIESCLDSLFRTEYPCFNVFVVDNGSSDESLPLIRNRFPNVKVIENGENLGFGKANAIGIEAGHADYVALLNNDTVVEKNWLRPLAEAMLGDASLASVCAKLLFMDKKKMINGVGGGMNFLGYGFDLGIYKVDDGSMDMQTEVFFPCAAACLIRRSAFEDVGGFDKKFFMYHEDVDLGWRFWLRGFRVKCVPESVVYHAFGGTSLRTGSMKFRNTLGLRHAIRSLLKNYEIGTLVRVLPIVILLGLRTTFKKRTLEFIRCMFWNIRMLPDTLIERRKVQKGRKVSDAEISHLIWPHIILPVGFPDYEIQSRDSFAAGKNKRNFFVMSDVRWNNLGCGWHGLETYFGDGRTKYRWSGNEAFFYLWNKDSGGTISLEVLALAGTIKNTRKLIVNVNDSEPVEFMLASEGWETIAVPHTCAPGPLEIKLEVDETWVPDGLFGNGDTRRLGIGLKAARCTGEECLLPSVDGVSVIIPTYNRAAALVQTLRALENQTLPKEEFEVIVVDDGSTDSTEMEMKSLLARTGMEVKYLKQPNKKQGAARNLGIRHSEKALIVFIGDDIVPSPSFLSEHMNFHRERNKYGNVAVIGYTKWPEDIRVTPFMHFIGEYGYQFGYSLIEGEGPVPFNFFYTSNISILKTFLERLEIVFEEDFTTYGWEDIELGFRLESIGMELLYDRHAVASHYHPVSVSSFCVRQEKSGMASRIFLTKHPELEWLLGNTSYLKKIAAFGIFTPALKKVLDLFDRLSIVPFPRRIYDIVLKASYAKGAIRAGRSS